MKFLPLLLLLFSVSLRAQLVGDKQSGLASYYSEEYNGAETAYGTTYNKNEMVAAHKAYPFNSTVSVRNESNGKTVVVRIVDKGPFIRGRIIELSERAARELGMLGERTVPVELTLLSTPDQQVRVEPEATIATVPAPRETPPEPTPLPPPATPVRTAEQPAAEAPVREPSPAPDVTAKSPTTVTAPDKPRYAKTKTFSPGIYKVNLLEPETGNYGVQVGSFAALESAIDKVVELQAKYFDDILLHKIGRGDAATYKVILGPFREQNSAQRYAADLKRRYSIQGFTVQLTE